MRMDLPLGSECLLPDGRRIEVSWSPPGRACDGCAFLGPLGTCGGPSFTCYFAERNDLRNVHFREIIMVADQETAGSPY